MKLETTSPIRPATPFHGDDWNLCVEQITRGPRHHFFGYIGHVRTIPWNASGRTIVALQTSFQSRMPKPGEAANIVLLDTRENYAVRVVERTRAWNFQQGTMLYWNPAAPETQFFFNDRDETTHELFCVLFDTSRGANGERVAEYRFPDTPIANSGVAQGGGWFCGINYGRLARLRPVTGYPGAYDWTIGEKCPANDGIFKVDVKTGRKTLIVSFRRLAEAMSAEYPDAEHRELFINHTLWSRDDSRIFFFVRGDFEVPGQRLDVPFTVNADGTNLHPLAMHIGGHPEWESDRTLIGHCGKDQILFDVERQKVVGTLGAPEVFPKPGGDIALSHDAAWFVNGHSAAGKNVYTIMRRADGMWVRSDGVDQGGYTTGELRIDPSPCWNREGTQMLIGGVANDLTRQLLVLTVNSGNRR